MPVKQRRDMVEEQLRTTAAAVFASNGFTRTSLADIAEALGTGRTSIYTYYSSKDELILALIKESAAEGRAILAAAQKAPSATPTEQLGNVVLRLAEYALARPDRVRLLNMTAGVLPPDAEKLARALNQRFFTELRTIIQAGMDAGDFRAGDAGVAAHTIIGAIRTAPWWFHEGAPMRAAPAGRQITEHLVRGLLTTQADTVSEAAREALATLRADLDHLEQTL
jgi:AcrR family transcriptional regulator